VQRSRRILARARAIFRAMRPSIALRTRRKASGADARDRAAGSAEPDRTTGFWRWDMPSKASLQRRVLWIMRHGRPRGRRISAQWRWLVALGVRGALATLLNDGRLWSSQEHLDVSAGLGDALHENFVRGGWPSLQWALVPPPPGRAVRQENAPSPMAWRPGTTLWLLRQASIEALLFSRARFDIGWCAHGKHWYVRGDKRQKDCPSHNKAGEQARWRKRKVAQEREEARQATLRDVKRGR